MRLPARASAALAAAALVVAGLAACSTGATTEAAPTATATSTPTPGPGAAGRLQDPDESSLSSAPAAGVVPTKIAIAKLGVSAGMQDLAIGAQGELDPPTNATDAGWYAKGVVPGAVGPAIIAGHIDSTTGPGVFLHLAQLAAGDTVKVTLSSGAVQTWSVTGSRAALKSEFPTSDVYGTSPTPQLRLITCGGTFDASIGHYDQNTIVFAELVSTTA
ncbi:sortase family protein [Frondihabitans sp. PhB188]|uniref:sortase domain-containing protein n=1 Tax=Frondihabitans sp. PhB188 TaxID=2485200 RepID=UPI000F49CEA1|nr:sortase [Frondihabitans sp. PhB188]ROQ38359.1 sortase family protein [Frondihabitans sp. PhB188]